MFQKFTTSINAWFNKTLVSLLNYSSNREWDRLLKSSLAPYTSKSSNDIAICGLIQTQYKTLREVVGESTDNQAIKLQQQLFTTAVKTIINTTVTLSNIVGVQALSAPVGLVYTMRYDKPTPTIGGDNNQLNTIRLQVLSNTIVANTRRLGVHMPLYTKPAEIELEGEISTAIANEIGCNMVDMVINDLHSIATTRTAFQLEDHWSVRDATRLSISINQACNKIAELTRRAAGNFIIASPTILTTLVQLPGYARASMDSWNTTGLCLAGILNETIRVYTSFNTNLTNDILVGYVGTVGATDTGYIYAPYVTLLSSGVVMDALTFEPTLPLLTRFGTSSNGAGREPFTNGNYYAVITVAQPLLETTTATN
jgi:hypothetical protein